MNNKNPSNTSFIPINYDILNLQQVEKILTLPDIFNRIDPENKRVFKYTRSGTSNQVSNDNVVKQHYLGESLPYKLCLVAFI